MDLKLFFAGFGFITVGTLMINDVRKRKPASENTNWEGQLMPQYIGFWCSSIISLIVGIVFIIESL